MNDCLRVPTRVLYHGSLFISPVLVGRKYQSCLKIILRLRKIRHKKSPPSSRRKYSVIGREMIPASSESIQVPKYLAVKTTEDDFAKVNLFIIAESISSTGSLKRNATISVDLTVET